MANDLTVFAKIFVPAAESESLGVLTLLNQLEAM